MSRIHEDHNGCYVTAHSKLSDGADVSGHLYSLHYGPSTSQTLQFQRGPVKDVGVNGITSEMLLAVLIDRTKHLDGQFPCEENKVALEGIEQAAVAFAKRTADRLARNVEGKNLA